jgi:hypothetical protein
LPASEAFKSFARVFALSAFGFILWKWLAPKLNGNLALLYGILGWGIVLASFSNVVSGVDVETASHVARYTQAWLIIGSFTAAYLLWSARQGIAQLPANRKCVVAALSALLVLANWQYFTDSAGAAIFDIGSQRSADADAQSAMPALRWLDAQSAEPRVVWTDPLSSLHMLVPNFTKDYLLFGIGGLMQLVSNDEIEERYLTAYSLSDLNERSIAADVQKFDGVGASLDTPNTLNRPVKFCHALHLDWMGRQCGATVDAQMLYGQHYKEMFAQYESIRTHLRTELQKFHVSYIMKDLQSPDFHPESLPFVKEVYSDEHFKIYEVR